MYSLDVFFDGCEDFSSGHYSCMQFDFQDRLEMMSFGYLSADEWLEKAECELAELDSDEWDTWGRDHAPEKYLYDEYLEPMMIGVERMYGIPTDFWFGYVSIDRETIESMFSSMDVLIQAVLDGIPIEDVFA